LVIRAFRGAGMAPAGDESFNEVGGRHAFDKSMLRVFSSEVKAKSDIE
jgi:hypothetical protein